jgi:hypothetical protein
MIPPENRTPQELAAVLNFIPASLPKESLGSIGMKTKKQSDASTASHPILKF